MKMFTYDGQISFNNTFLDDGTLILSGTLITIDGISLYFFRDHIIPFYRFSSRLQSKVLIGTYISYNITLTCENSADPGYPLKVTIPIPSELKYITSISPEGSYNPETGIWTVKLVKHSATLNFILQPINTGTVTQTITLQKDGTSLTRACEIIAEDTGDIYYNEEPLKDYPISVNNLQDGQLYTIIK
jgi:hypothetical protein